MVEAVPGTKKGGLSDIWTAADLPHWLLTALDQFIVLQEEPRPSRFEALQSILADRLALEGLLGCEPGSMAWTAADRRGSDTSARRMANSAIDRALEGSTATSGQQDERRGRLVKAPRRDQSLKR